jgi:hypothetical protein
MFTSKTAAIRHFSAEQKADELKTHGFYFCYVSKLKSSVSYKTLITGRVLAH